MKPRADWCMDDLEAIANYFKAKIKETILAVTGG
jgi:hypothetical protein